MIKVFLSGLVLAVNVFAGGRIDIGQHAFIKILENDMSYLARIDSGARITSLHAINIKLEGDKSLLFYKPTKRVNKAPTYRKIKNQDYRNNIGRVISFDTENEVGKKRHMKMRVQSVARVRNAQGTEYRYVVRLALQYKNIVKFKEVNLRDRSRMTYKLLIGRNWLNHDFAIKTDLDLIKK